MLRASLTTKCFRFLKILESYNGGDDHYRGRDGELSVSDLRNPNAACAARLKVAVEYGLPLNPSFNAATTFGVGACQVIHTRKLLIHKFLNTPSMNLIHKSMTLQPYSAL